MMWLEMEIDDNDDDDIMVSLHPQPTQLQV